MITQQEYEIAYTLYNEGRILESTMISLELHALTEATEVLEEGVTDTIKKYIGKVIAGIQKAWNSFKAAITKKKNLPHKTEDIKKSIANAEPDITVNNWVVYDDTPLRNSKVVAFDWNTMKDSLFDKNTFLKKYYPSIFTDPNKSVKENLMAKLIKSKEDKHKVTREDLTQMYSYIDDGFNNTFNKLSVDMESINKASKNIDQLASTINEASTSNNRSIREEILAKAIKALEDQGLSPKVMNKDKEKWLSSGDSGHFGGGLCITNLTKDVHKYTSAVNKVIKPLGGTLTPDNYGTAFLKVNKALKEESYFTEEESPKPQVTSGSEEKKEETNGTNNPTGEKKETSQEVVKKIQVYFKATTELLTAEMAACTDILGFYIKVITLHTANYLKNRIKNKGEEKKPDQPTKETKTEVEI